jgi:LysR family transcriptional regulator (chromosome initiation inhibitor)
LSPQNFRSLRFIAFNRKDDLQSEFVGRALKLKQVTLSQLYVPSSEGQVRAVLDGWGVSVVPQLQVREHLSEGRLVDIAPGHALPVELYWHCWNLDSAVLDALTEALTSAASLSLTPNSGSVAADQRTNRTGTLQLASTLVATEPITRFTSVP